MPYVVSQVSAHGHLKFTAKNPGMGAYTEKPFVHIMHIYARENHRIIENGGWALTRENMVHCTPLFLSLSLVITAVLIALMRYVLVC